MDPPVTARATRSPAAGSRAVARQRRHERIIDAATELFSELGFETTTVDQIAQRARVSKGLVYDHYPSKKALMAEVWKRQAEAWRSATRLAVKHAKGSVADNIGEAMAASIRHARDTPMLRRILMQNPGAIAERTPADVSLFGRGYRARLEAALTNGVGRGELRPDLDVPRTAELIWLLHVSLIWEMFIGSGKEPRTDAESLIRASVALVVSGIRAAP